MIDTNNDSSDSKAENTTMGENAGQPVGDASSGKNPNRWQLLLDLVAFQFKLALDALRDLLLSPISIGTALFGIVTDRDNPGKYFYSMLRQGHKSDSWINLFGTGSDSDQEDDTSQLSSDNYVRKLESFVVDEYDKGGIVKNLKDKADKIIDKAHRD
jgi:hypothetical protein